MKKTLSLIMALILIITTFAFVGTTVYAADTDVYASYTVSYSNKTTGDFKEVGITDKGRSNVCHFYRNGDETTNRNTFIDLTVDSGKYTSSNYHVYEVSLFFGENINKFSIKPDCGGSSVVVYFSQLDEGILKQDDWNDLKIIVTDDTSVDGYYRAYLNENYIGRGNINKNYTTADHKTRITFNAYDATSKNDDPTKKEEVWVDVNSIKITEKALTVTSDGHAYFNREDESQNGTLIVGAFNEDGTLAKVNTKPVSASNTLASDFTGAYNYKAFLFNNLTDIKPLINSVSFK